MNQRSTFVVEGRIAGSTAARHVGHVARVDAAASRLRPARLRCRARLGDRGRSAERLLVHVAQVREVEQVVADQQVRACRSAGSPARCATPGRRRRSCRAAAVVGPAPGRPSRRRPTCSSPPRDSCAPAPPAGCGRGPGFRRSARRRRTSGRGSRSARSRPRAGPWTAVHAGGSSGPPARQPRRPRCEEPAPARPARCA
jgi:hypothetical protein